MSSPRIYLDHAATTPLHPEVRRKMSEVSELFGNPSSLHEDGRRAKDVIDQSRETLAGELRALFAEVIFTGSGSESVNMALIGAALANDNPSRSQIVFSSVEHHCVLHTRPILERLGYEVLELPVDHEGFLDPDVVDATISDRTLLLSVMHANNELGTIEWANTMGSVAERNGAIFHCDMVQTFAKGYGHIDGAQMISVAAHKINGPKGVGALFIRGGTKIKPLLTGGAQERELRAGTENIVGIAGFGEAVRQRIANPISTKNIRDHFEQRLISAGAVSTVTAKARLDSHCHVRFPGIDAETLLIRLDREGISASSGAACSSGSVEASHVLLACGYSEAQAKEGLRFTFGMGNTLEESDRAASIVTAVVQEFQDRRK